MRKVERLEGDPKKKKKKETSVQSGESTNDVKRW